MSSYRFCRTDDVPALVEAYDRCFRVHYPELPAMTVDDFRRGSRELGLWASSCMLASDGKQPIGVLLAAKRETENWIHSVGVHPDYQRQGHAGHMLSSLSQKLAILGPPRLLAEIPEQWSAARALFESCGYRPETTFTDFTREPTAARAEAHEAVIPVTLDELLDSGALAGETRRAWARSPLTLAERRDGLHGLALGFGDRFEAWLLYGDADDEAGPREIQAIGCADPARADALLEILVDACAAGTHRPLAIPRLSDEEASFDLLRRWGFREGRRTVGFAAQAGDS